jgi:hypothetical protein
MAGNTMNPESQIAQLAAQAYLIRGLTDDIAPAQAAWKPDPASWSVIEVVNHLYDEEREDFRAHLAAVLAGPDASWAPIDPPGWVTQRRYAERDLAQSAANFLRERERSLAWLRGLTVADWDIAYLMPWGSITAGDLLASWVAHDLLHIRQLVELRWGILVNAVAPYQVRYAGEW